MIEDDLKLKWVANEKKILLILKKFHDIFGLNPKISSEMQNDALMHREDSNG